MAAQRIDGKAIAQIIKDQCAQECAQLKEQGIFPTLAVILVGNDPASLVYKRNKERACKQCGIRSQLFHLPEETTQQELLDTIRQVNEDPSIHGLLLQLPLPAHLNEQEALLAIDYKKDVDGFHPVNAGALMEGHDGLTPCTPSGCIELLKRSGVVLDGAHAVVLGRSNIVGKPMSFLLLRENCTVTICHSHTKNLADITRQADILVCAIGKPRFVTRDMVKPGAAVIDVGINRLEDGTLCGDADTEEVAEVAGWITPVPGGVGPMTVAFLMKNTVEAARKHGR